jgi:4a-hydroxytetrahydrobiopterin dehydratase
VAKLSDAAITERLGRLDDWKREGDFITKTFEFRTFMAGIKFVNDIAKIAEKLEHHPDIHIRYTTIRLSVQSHDEGGITTRDFRLAEQIEKFLHQKPAKMR